MIIQNLLGAFGVNTSLEGEMELVCLFILAEKTKNKNKNKNKHSAPVVLGDL